MVRHKIGTRLGLARRADFNQEQVDAACQSLFADYHHQLLVPSTVFPTKISCALDTVKWLPPEPPVTGVHGRICTSSALSLAAEFTKKVDLSKK